MIIKDATPKEIVDALNKVNEQFNNNIKFKRFEFIGFTRKKERKYRITLTVVDSSVIGGRRGNTGRRIAAACWHVHGTFFDSLPENAEIIVGNNTKIAPGDKWLDKNIGSLYNPMMYSEACECD